MITKFCVSILCILVSCAAVNAEVFTVSGITVEDKDGVTVVGKVFVDIMNSKFQRLATVTSDPLTGNFVVQYSTQAIPQQPYGLLEDGLIVIQVTRPNGLRSRNIYDFPGAANRVINPPVP